MAGSSLSGRNGTRCRDDDHPQLRLARGAGRWQRLAQFNVVNGLLAITGQLVFTSLYVKVFDIHYALANLLAIVTCSVLSFVVNDRLVFRAGTSPILELATLGETPCDARHAERR